MREPIPNFFISFPLFHFAQLQGKYFYSISNNYCKSIEILCNVLEINYYFYY